MVSLRGDDSVKRRRSMRESHPGLSDRFCSRWSHETGSDLAAESQDRAGPEAFVRRPPLRAGIGAGSARLCPGTRERLTTGHRRGYTLMSRVAPLRSDRAASPDPESTASGFCVTTGQPAGRSCIRTQGSGVQDAPWVDPDYPSHGPVHPSSQLPVSTLSLSEEFS
jgi:hypothetical protein